MKIYISKNNCSHLKQLSVYNSNYYQLPFVIDGCDVLFESFDGSETFCGNSIGIMFKGRFEEKFFLHQEHNFDGFFFDSETISDKNQWT